MRLVKKGLAMRGQASIEYALIIGVVLVVTIPLFYYVSQQSSQSLKSNQVFDTVHTLAGKADAVYALGPGTRDYVWISIPGGVTSSLIGNKTILLRMSDGGDVHSFTRANVTGSIPVQRGTYRVVVEVLDNRVFIGVVNDTSIPLVVATAPSGIVRITNPVLSATTSESAQCKYGTSDAAYTALSNTFSGSGIGHTSPLSGLSEGSYVYYVRCKDNSNNTMSSSAQISFTVSLDSIAPIVNRTGVEPKKGIVGTSVCVNVSVSDANLETVLAQVSSPLSAPYVSVVNYTLSDTGSACAGVSGDTWYGADIIMQAVGNNFVNTSFANDSGGNLGVQSPYPLIQINVTANKSVGPGEGLTYVMVDKAEYWKTPALLLNYSDTQMSSFTDDSVAMTDDDKNTPPSADKVKWSAGFYEGFSFQLNRTPGSLEYVSLRVKVVDSDITPYNLTIYSYKADKANISVTNWTTFQITQISQNGVNRGFNEVMITNLIKSQPSNSVIRVRVIPNGTSMLNRVMHISEADFGIA